MQPGHEVPDVPPETGATPPPLGFTLVLWFGVFFTLVWGFQVLFARRASPPPQPRGGPDGEDVTLEEPGPDRS